MKFLKNKFSFTLIEVMLVIVIISTGLIGLLMSISYGSTSLEKIRKEVIAINIAREGMESIYNIRDTNRTRWSGKLASCWLKIDPLVDGGSQGCENDLWMSGYNYILSGATISGQNYFTLVPNANTLNLKNGISSQDINYTMCLDNGFWYNCPNGNGYIKEGKFFRMIRGIGLVDKNSNIDINCTDGTGLGCGNDSAKEYRFCSVVEYQGQSLGKIELCGVLTNFK